MATEPPPRHCGLYTPGHVPHWIQVVRSADDLDDPPVPGRLLVAPLDGRVVVQTAGARLVLLNHEPARLRVLAARAGNRVTVQRTWSLLRVKSREGWYVFSVAVEGEAYAACPPARRRQRSPPPASEGPTTLDPLPPSPSLRASRAGPGVRGSRMADQPSIWDRIRRALSREKRDIDEAIEDATRRGNEVLDQKERERNATPEERLVLEQERAAATDDEYEALKRRIEGGGA